MSDKPKKLKDEEMSQEQGGGAINRSGTCEENYTAAQGSCGYYARRGGHESYCSYRFHEGGGSQ